ncbi:hypothetical protein KSP39_PZI004840 [Platanthera zijinensis]|uniref:Uncharacterized protein n=1 Tax=Platanthera zijinensis TaxID=2320716 RepID=A0AAP0GBW0_9ASPA
MAENPKLLFIVVVDEGEKRGDGKRGSFKYTRPVLQSTLQFMGCKARHSFKISRKVFDVMRYNRSIDGITPSWDASKIRSESNHEVLGQNLIEESMERSSKQFEMYKRQATVVVARRIFLNVVRDALSLYKYVGPNQMADLLLACRIRERKQSVTILLCGTSGCGKSTLSALLGSRLGITNVISTDSIRHMMRSFVDEKENPLLWSSTYHAGECLDPIAVAKAKLKRKAKRLSVSSQSFLIEGFPDTSTIEHWRRKSLDAGSRPEIIGKKQMAIEGFKAQSEMVIDSLDRLITAWEDQNQSAIVEGVHLNINFVMGLMKKHPSIIPFMMYITNEEKHKERFAVRAKYMALDPAKNKYVKYIHNIRSIQDYLCNRADKHLVPKINNTNVDRSVAAIHATVFSCLRRQEAGEKLYDPVTNTAPVIYEEHRNQCAANSLSSKGVLQLIQRQGSSRHLMALVNTDGSVARAWSVDSVNDNMIPSSQDRSCEKSKMHDSVPICKAEPVNLQFGNFGISAWANDAGGTSYAGSMDESSCPSSPRISGTSKEPMEEMSVSGTDDEADEAPAADSEDDHIYSPNEMHEEMQGSVDEESTKSDEEYDDLAMLDGLDEGYSSADDGHAVSDSRRLTNFVPAESNSVKSIGLMELMEKYQQSLDLFLENGEALQQPWHNHFLPDRRRENKDESMSKLSQTDRIEVISKTL